MSETRQDGWYWVRVFMEDGPWVALECRGNRFRSGSEWYDDRHCVINAVGERIPPPGEQPATEPREAQIATFVFPWTVSLSVDEEGDTIARFTDAPPNIHLAAHGKDAHEALTILTGIVKTWREMEAEEKAATASALPLTKCGDCGAPYGQDGWCDVIVPDEIWNQLGDGLLCFRCMTKRLEAGGHKNVPVAIVSGPYEDASEKWRLIGWQHGYDVAKKELTAERVLRAMPEQPATEPREAQFVEMLELLRDSLKRGAHYGACWGDTLNEIPCNCGWDALKARINAAIAKAEAPQTAQPQPETPAGSNAGEPQKREKPPVTAQPVADKPSPEATK